MKNPLPTHSKQALLFILIVAAAAFFVFRKAPVRDAVTPPASVTQQTSPAQVQSPQEQGPPTANPSQYSQSAQVVDDQPQASPGTAVQTEQSNSPATDEQSEIAALSQKMLNPQLREAILSARHIVQKAKPSNQAKRQEKKAKRQNDADKAFQWRMMQMVDENGTVPEGALIRAWNQVKQMAVDPQVWPAGSLSPSVAGIQPAGWTWLGPGNVGGRVRSIVIHPTDPQTMWAGSVGGGVWKTTNGGTSWVALDDLMANLAIGSLAIDPTNPNVLYAGTGEGFGNLDSIRGAGIFKTTDGGTTWAQLTSTSTWTAVNRIAIDPTNNQILLAATGFGIFRSTDGGGSWLNRSPLRAQDINFHPTDGSRAIASGSGSSSGTRYSTDGGETWAVATGISGSLRVEVAYSRSNPSVVYAGAESSSGQVYKSVDGGQSYSLVNTGTNYLGNQGWYDNIVWVDPTNENLVIVGGIDLWRSTNGGVNFTRISQWFSAPISAHADHHAIVESPQFDGVNNKTVLFGNDGGVYRTTDVYSVSLTSGWQELNNNLGITQFYGGAGNLASGRIIGGTQDNGTLRHGGGLATESWTTMNGGDGGWSASDPTDANYFYGEFQWLGLHRSTNGGISSSNISQGITDAFANGPTNFIAPFILDPNNPNTLLAGGANLWRTTNAKGAVPLGWGSIKTPIGSNISAIAVAKGNSDIIWVGHNNGNVYYTTNGTAANPTWNQADLGSPALPNLYCTRLTIDPTNSNRVYATFGSFSSISGKVWRTDNNGASWTDISANLPLAPVRSLVVWEQNPNFLYVGTEVGVFASANGGQSWSPSNDGPTNCSVDELFWMGNTLVAVTHGRGMFSINVGTGQLPSVNITSPTTGASFNAGDNVTITAEAGDTDGTIAKVDFFAGSTLIGTATVSPYTTTWNNVPGGIHILTARATDNSGDSAVSNSVNINVTGGGGCSSTPISLGQTINGTLAATDCNSEDGSFYDLYFFNGTGGQEVAVSMSSNSFDTVLVLLAPDGNLVAFDDDGGGGLNSRIPPGSGFVTLPTTGTYTIVAEAYSSASVGSYSLTLTGTPPITIQLNSLTYSVGEGGGAANVSFNRNGSSAGVATVNYRTTDTAGLTNCNVLNGVASARCDYTTSVGTVRFAAGETLKNISIPIVDDSYAEGNENFTITLSNVIGATLGVPGTATITITDNEAVNGPNPVDTTAFFVRQQYLDFLNREPDSAGYAAWQSVIDNCPPNDTTCDRIHVSSSFFRSPEFQDRGYFVYRFYPTAFGRKPDYDEFVPDLAKVSGFLSVSELEAAKVEFITEFMSRPAFANTYNGLNNTQYVDTLLATAGVAPHQFRDFWIAALGNGTRTRATVLRDVAEGPEVYNKYYNQAFVVMQYFGYLRRQPDGQYLAWIAVLDSTADYRGMINGFMNSAEYRARFGP